jgi:hypothetical protein
VRIAYVNLLIQQSVGVENKLRGQSGALDALGIDDFDIFVLNVERQGVEGRVRHVCIPRTGVLGNLNWAVRRFELLRSAANWDEYDILVLRYPFADRGAPHFAEEFPVVSEHHTKEIQERKALLESAVPLWRRAFYRCSLFLERKYGPRFLQQSRGIIGVTDEIRAYEVARAVTPRPSLTLPNGISVSEVPFTRFAPFDGRELRLVFTASDARPWHGLDRLLRSLAEYRGSLQICCNLVGRFTHGVADLRLPESVKLLSHGTLRGRDLDQLLSQMHLGVGSLALFRNGMVEACTLKTREYVARGLPFIIAHDDPDLQTATGDARFFLRMPADDSPIPLDDLVAFAEEMSIREKIGPVSVLMREYAERHMDWRGKMADLVDFLKTVAR